MASDVVRATQAVQSLLMEEQARRHVHRWRGSSIWLIRLSAVRVRIWQIELIWNVKVYVRWVNGGAQWTVHRA